MGPDTRPMTPRYTPVDDVAKSIPTTRRKLLRFCRAHDVPFLDLNGDIFFDAIALEKLEAACRSKYAAAGTQGRSKSTGQSGRRARRPASEFESARDLTTQLLLAKKQSTESAKSSGRSTSGSVLTFGPSPKHTAAT